MKERTWVGRAGTARAACEAGLAAGALVLVLAILLQLTTAAGVALDVPRPENRWPELAAVGTYAGLVSGLLGTVRLRRGSGPAPALLIHEITGAAALLLALGTGALLALVAAAAIGAISGLPGGGAGATVRLVLPPLFGVACLAYPLGRGAALVWPAWDRLRRTRLLWALTHAQLVGCLTLAAGIAILLTTFGYAYRSTIAAPAGTGSGNAGLPWLLPATIDLMLLGVAASAVLLPPAALVSYLALRRTTRRIEELAVAVSAFRRGDLTARVEAGGDDEVGRLQGDFNAMAGDLERTLRDLQAERDRVAGLLDAHRQLVVSVSHELRTPVATVRGYLDAARLHEAAVPEALRADFAVMVGEIERLQRLIDDLFTLSRAEVGPLELRPAPTDVAMLVHRLVETVAPLAWQQRRVQVLAELPPNLPLARADAARLEQVVSNLLSNAVRHTPPGGIVAAMVATTPDAVRVDVRDTGEGIAPDDLPHIFDRFYRGPQADGAARDGAGLGLALAKELTEAMGGAVAAASHPGEGSCFTLRLPRA